jgi:hypothetical protein
VTPNHSNQHSIEQFEALITFYQTPPLVGRFGTPITKVRIKDFKFPGVQIEMKTFA